MTGRDPNEEHRAATTLELFFDLVFVIAFGQAANEFAHMIAEGYYRDGLIGFAFVMLAIIWAWGNFTWFASAYDTDDWVYRLVTMVQMIGVLVNALGIHALFASIHEGGPLDARVMVFGYVIMRIAMVSQWLRAAHDDAAHRGAAMTYAVMVTGAQIGWVLIAISGPTLTRFLAWGTIFFVVEFGGPLLAERKSPTPWHPHHIAERYGLLTIIALGECILGAFLGIQAVIESQGWSWQVAVVGLSGTALALGLWWMYFLLPSGEILQVQRYKAAKWSYGHLLIFVAITGVGAGLHVAAYSIEHVAHIGEVAVVLSVVIPVAAFMLLLNILYAYLVGRFDPFHYVLMAGAVAILALAVIAAAVHVPLPVCLLIVTLAPTVTVVGYELLGHEHHERMMADVERMAATAVDA